MYATLYHVLQNLAGREEMETWIVCLTDGISDSVLYDHFRAQISQALPSVNLVAVGINLHELYEQNLRAMCRKYSETADEASKGFFVRADGTTAGMNQAFGVVKRNIPVSQMFELDGVLSDEDCLYYMSQYLPSFIDPHDMISQSFWLRFLYRRTQVFDSNHHFNFNETHDSLGSSLMEVMLSEVERLLSENQQREWLMNNHAQLIYDFTVPNEPEFRLVCTAPEELDPELRRKLASLDLPGFRIPMKADLDQRSVLDRFLSQALEIPLHTRDDGSDVLQCIDENNFILTLDFTMKLLNIHERVSCRVPCVIEGETGVSKTALTKMYSILRNSALVCKAKASVRDDIQYIEEHLANTGYNLPAPDGTCRLYSLIREDETAAEEILRLLREKLFERPSIFQSLPDMLSGICSTQETALHTLDFFFAAKLERTFFEINIDASLTELEVTAMFQEVCGIAHKLIESDATIVVFLDGAHSYSLCLGWFLRICCSRLASLYRFIALEINTSSILGLLKEIVVDHSLGGESLPRNIVLVAACNPPRREKRSF
jgi:hypothetical protein